MKWCLCALLASILALTVNATARDVVLPAGTLLQCTLNEPNFSTNTVSVGDPVLCHLRSQVEFGQQTFPRGSYLVGHLEAAKDPGHFVGKGYLELRFDRIGVPSGDIPLDAKVISAGKYKVDREGKIDGRGHAKRDIVEWMLPPLWPWKVLMLPARGPRPTLKNELVMTLRLMDDIQLPQVAHGSAPLGPEWHYFGEPRNGSFDESQVQKTTPQLAVRNVTPVSGEEPVTVPQVSYANYVTKVPPVVTLSSPRATRPATPEFVLKSGMVLSVNDFTYRNGRITYKLTGGGGGVISTDEIDWSATARVNNESGVRVTLHSGHQNLGTASF